MTYQNNYPKNCYYQPRRPVKSFQDLEVYQKLNNLATVIVKRVTAEIARPSGNEPVAKHASRKTAPEIADLGQRLIEEFSEKLCRKVLILPELIASAHSIRFSDQPEAIKKLEEAMLGCNLVVVYLEQFRDLGQTEIETAFFDEQIKVLLATRGKVLHLQMSWKKFFGEKQQ